METEDGPDPADINKSPEIIQEAKTDIKKLDILVCGRCHEVSHFIEEFQEHQQSGNCTETSTLKETKHEARPQVWAFLLWKQCQLKKLNKENETLPTAWNMYQNWSKIKSEEKETWIKAGENIQLFTKIGAAKIQEIKKKMQLSLHGNKPAIDKFKEEPLEEGEIRLSSLTNAQRIAIKARVAAKKPKVEDTADSDLTSEDEKGEKKKSGEGLKKAPLTPVQISSNENIIIPAIKRPPEQRKALRTNKEDNTEETVVEKLLNRRFSQKKKTFEYLVKWENLLESDNTWEPKAHFESCKSFLEEFDKIFNKNKISTSKVVQKPQASELSNVDMTPGRRPQRTSKQKALNQVKAWCGDITEGEDSIKRKNFSDDDDSSDSFEKKIKLEEDTDTSDEDKPSVTIRRVLKTPGSLNGVAKKSTDISHAVQQRVVRVIQKQIPNLSSGVYVMSKTGGIAQIDTNSLPISLKMGQKIGDTHIKVIKRDGSNLKHTSVKGFKPKSDMKVNISAGRGGSRYVPHKLVEVPGPFNTAFGQKKKEQRAEKNISADDESDGLEEMDFPNITDPPAPESPPGEFILCPLTGKILGAPDTPPRQEEEVLNETATTLDNLVKQAVADLPDDALNQPEKKPEIEGVTLQKSATTESTSRPLNVVSKSQLTATVTKITTPQNGVGKAVVSSKTLQGLQAQRKESEAPAPVISTKPDGSVKSEKPSILSAALTKVPALLNRTTPQPQKKLLNAKPGSKIATISRVVSATPGTSRTPIPTPNTTIIHKITPGRTKTVMTSKMQIVPSIEPMVKRSPNVTTYKSAAKRATPASSTFKTTATIVKTTPPRPGTVVAVPSSTHSQATIINMPLLADDPATTASTSATTSALARIQTAGTESTLGELANINMAESETPLLITGDDGTIYQVAGQNEEGQTILISEGPDGQQQCVIVSSEVHGGAGESQTVATDTEAERTQQTQVQQQATTAQPDDAENDEESQVVAQIIKADPPSPGGTRNVVLMLPDGNLMMTNVTAEQYAALELDK